MIYAVEAVRWNDAGSVSHVRWHPIDLDNEKLVHGNSVVVPVETAIEEATWSREKRVCRAWPRSRVRGSRSRCER